MASQWSDLKIQLMATGENTTTWGSITNANLGTAIEDAITGSVDVSFTGSNVALAASNSTAAQDFRNLRLNLTGTGLGALTGLTVPNIEKVYIVNNGLSDSVEITSGTGANGTATIPNGTTSIVFCTGSNKVATVINYLPSLSLGTPLPVSSGGTGSNTGVNVQSVSGVLPIANGGTGSATAAFNGSGITNLNATAISSGTIANSYTTANSANQANAIVARDGSGNFAANTITASLNGTASGNPTSIVAGTGLTGGGSSGAVTLSVQTTYQSLGTYIFAGFANGSTTGLTAGGTIAGSDLYPAGIGGFAAFAQFGGSNDNTYYFAGNSSAVQQKKNSFTGTWQSMGCSANATTNSYCPCTLYIRIA